MSPWGMLPGAGPPVRGGRRAGGPARRLSCASRPPHSMHLGTRCGAPASCGIFAGPRAASFHPWPQEPAKASHRGRSLSVGVQSLPVLRPDRWPPPPARRPPALAGRCNGAAPSVRKGRQSLLRYAQDSASMGPHRRCGKRRGVWTCGASCRGPGLHAAGRRQPQSVPPARPLSRAWPSCMTGTPAASDPSAVPRRHGPPDRRVDAFCHARHLECLSGPWPSPSR